MNQDIKTLWVAALRSGEFTQGRGELRVDDTYCCLGVLCELHARTPDVKIGWAFSDEGLWHYDDNLAALPLSVRNWAGLPTASPDVRGENLATLNDGVTGYRQHTFGEIADLIEAHL